MRNYWLRIFIGAFVIFALGMVGVSLVRRGVATVNSVLKSDEPITIPLSFVPFMLSGERLGRLERVVVLRDAPRRVRAVELEIDLADSLLAQGLRGCRLVANFESDPGTPGFDIRAPERKENTFSCLTGDSIPADLVEFGQAILQPGDVRVPLYLQEDLVTEMHEALADESATSITEDQADSLAALAELKSDSAVAEVIRAADSIGRAGRRLGDSLRAEARRHADSVLADTRRMADTLPDR